MAGCGIFCLGCGLSIYHGVEGIIEPHPVEPNIWVGHAKHDLFNEQRVLGTNCIDRLRCLLQRFCHSSHMENLEIKLRRRDILHKIWYIWLLIRFIPWGEEVDRALSFLFNSFFSPLRLKTWFECRSAWRHCGRARRFDSSIWVFFEWLYEKHPTG